MTDYYDIKDMQTKFWGELDKKVKGLEETAKNMSRQQKRHYMSLYKVSIYEEIRAMNYVLQTNDFDAKYFVNNFPKEIRNNVDFMKSAIILHPELIMYAGDVVGNNYEFAEFIVRVDGKYLRYLSGELRNNKDIVKLAVCNGYWYYTPTSFEFASDELKNNKEFVLELLDVSPSIYEYVSIELKNDHDVTIAAIIKDSLNLTRMPEKFKTDKEFLKDLVRKYNVDFHYISAFRCIDKDLINEIAKELIDENPMFIMNIGFEKIDYLCKTCAKEYMNNVLEYLKQHEYSDKHYQKLVIDHIDHKISGIERKRTNKDTI